MAVRMLLQQSLEFRNTEWFQSCPHKVLARCGWSLYVGLGGQVLLSITQDYRYSWEFVTTLHFEWSIIRGHRYRWTIWVCNDYLFSEVPNLWVVVVGELIFAFW